MSNTLCTLCETLGIQVPFFFSSFCLTLITNLSLKPGYQTWILSPGLSLPPAPSLFCGCLYLYGSSTLAPNNAVVSSPMKNSSRVKCRGSGCGGGKPGFWHVCSICGKRFCPKCVRPRYRHACMPSVPPAGPPDDESEPRTNESIVIPRSEL